MYSILFSRFGPQGWWPGETSGEHLAGCILAQNTRWDRVEPVIQRLKGLGMLEENRLTDLSLQELSELLRGSGTYRRKAEYLQCAWNFMVSIGWNGTPASVSMDTPELRKQLLSLRGIGPETCDCILLFVLERPVFVVDAYTKRILSRHRLCSAKDSYSSVQGLFHASLEPDPTYFKEYHALLVACAKEFCKPSPKCGNCPLNERTVEC